MVTIADYIAIDTTSIIYFLMVGFGLVLALTYKDVMLSIKVKLFHKKGHGFIRMVMPDRQEHLDFVDLKAGTFKLFGKRYVVDVTAGTFMAAESEVLTRTKKKQRRIIQLMMGVANKFRVKDEVEEAAKREILKKLDAVLKARSRGEYLIDLEAITMKGKYPVFTYRWDRSEPIDLMKANKTVDPDMFEAAVIKAKAQGSILDVVGQNKKLIYILLGIAVGVAASAYFSYEVFIAVQDSVAQGRL